MSDHASDIDDDMISGRFIIGNGQRSCGAFSVSGKIERGTACHFAIQTAERKLTGTSGISRCSSYVTFSIGSIDILGNLGTLKISGHAADTLQFHVGSRSQGSIIGTPCNLSAFHIVSCDTSHVDITGNIVLRIHDTHGSHGNPSAVLGRLDSSGIGGSYSCKRMIVRNSRIRYGTVIGTSVNGSPVHGDNASDVKFALGLGRLAFARCRNTTIIL